MINLLIMRHGEAQAVAASDSERALTPAGVAQAQRVATWLAQQDLCIDLICHSPYVRAQQTMAEMSKALPHVEVRELSELQPSGTPTAVLRALDSSSGRTILCVSHQPLVGNLRNYLVDGSVESGYPYNTAGIALLECEYLAPGTARMAWMRNPEECQ